MKCKSCAGNYKTKELICPYCGRANLLGKLWFAEKSEAEKEYEKARAEYEKRVTPYVLNRFLNRSLVICFLVYCLFFVGTVAFVLGFGMYREAYQGGLLLPVEKKMADYYEAGDYLGLHAYMSTKDYISNKRYKYSQAAILGREYAYFQAEKLTFFSLDEEDMQERGQSILGSILDHGASVSGPQIGTYSEPDPANEEIIQEMRGEVYALLHGSFDITEEEWEPFTVADKYGEVDAHELAAILFERRAWDE
jgi:hypothetical protein